MFQSSFTYAPLPGRVIFGAGSLGQLSREFRELQVSRALVLCTPDLVHLAEKVASRLSSHVRACSRTPSCMCR
jgi:alcohol dehydrogenase class IV